MRRRSGLRFGHKKKKVNVSMLKEVVIWTFEIILVLAISFVFVYFIGLRTSVVGQSMAPTLESKQSILVNRFIYQVKDPKKDDIVVFLPNGNEKSHYYVKRVIGVPGDTIQIKEGMLFINEEVYSGIVDFPEIVDGGLALEPMKLETDEYFVIGDNPNNSEDSRYANVGNVKKEYIIGKAWYIVSPFKDFGFIK